MTGGRAPYQKGYRFEKAIQLFLSNFGDCVRTFMSGAYTGVCDLLWMYRNRRRGISCKIKGNGFKTIYDELERPDVDIFIGRADRKPAIICMYLHDLPEFLGEDGE